MARRLFGTSSASSEMHDEKADDRGHGGEMHVARDIVTAEQRGQFRKLHRLPDRQPRQDDDNGDDKDAGIKQLLHGVVVREVVMRELDGERRLDVGNHLARLRSAAACGESGR